MHGKSLLFAVTLLLLVSAHLIRSSSAAESAATATATADDLWNKYRDNIINLLSTRYSHYAGALKAFDANTDPKQSILSVVTDPMEATWGVDPKDLAQIAGFVPRWSSSFDYQSLTEDGKIENLYKSLILSLKDKKLAAEEYVRFSTLPAKTYEESTKSETLAAFSARLASTPANSFTFEVSHSKKEETVTSPWGSNTQKFKSMSSIVREILPAAKPKPAADDDYELEADSEADAAFLFRRRRRRSAPQVVQQQIITKAEKFKMVFKAAGVIGIPVRPSFVSRQFIRRHRSSFTGGPWFGQNGKMCLLPSIIWVAMKPSVTLRLAESEFKQIKQHWVSGKSLGLATGSVFFRNQAFKALAESGEGLDVLADAVNPEILSYMLETGDLEDTATFRELSTEELEAEAALEMAAATDSMDDTEVQDEEMLAAQGEETLSTAESEFLFRRRRRRRSAPPPPPPPPPPKEKVYEASFSSNSKIPQIIAVTSDIL